jgi:hypothetical protein
MKFSCRPVNLDFIERAPWRFENEVDLVGTPEAVFDLFADGASWPKWFDGIRKVVWTTPDPKGVGTTRTVTLTTTTVYEYFLAWERGHRFCFRFVAASLPLFKAGIEDYRLESLGERRTRFRYGVYLEPSWMGKALAPVVRPMFARMFSGAAIGLQAYCSTHRLP